ncbi:histidine phosphatase family protein [Bradyrhizobium sp.]|uniref:histidine phosphatase family protein n=1 Tax=Bradyrhizobium sp. TaxID=376 RepID=UPI001ED28582|nr:histidine phosphatase family protein [Bradyrhizobium sp.]MBV8919249.1 histidine phosphatase family protein [Bradyrhizobium sp.]MBV9978939.1 histidine phosphatase family protein [Bradyrhizobium sp.]
MGTKTILVMRHAEKSGDPLDPNLTDKGRERANALVDYIPNAFGSIPKFLFASAVSKHSRRPIETLEPLAAKFDLSIDSTFADQDYGALAHHLRHSGQFDDVLSVVCWHHGNIPSLMHALKADASDYPDPWERDIFNLILRVILREGGQPPIVAEVTEPF